MHYHEIIIANLTVPITALIYERVTFPESRPVRVLNDIVAGCQRMTPRNCSRSPLVLIVTST